MKRNHLIWQITLRAESAWQNAALPTAILTGETRFPGTGMPDEVALLLPNTDGAAGLISDVTEEPALVRNRVLGLFLSDPFFNVEAEGAKLRVAGATWIANLPSVEQQDADFVQLLGDVGLDHGLEMERLESLKDAGHRVLAVVAGAAGAAAAAGIAPDAMLVLPRIVDFAAGFPSFRQRGAALREVADAAADSGWQGPLLGLAAASEVGHETLWPDVMDGVVCRPEPLDQEPLDQERQD